MEQKTNIISYIQNISVFLIGIFLIGFPLVVATTTTNPIILPKQILLGAVVLLVLLLFGASMLIERMVRIRKTYFDIAIILFTFVTFLSSIFAINRADSLMVFVPFLISVLLYFLIVNIAKDRNSILFFMSCLVVGAVLLSIFTILSYFKIYLLPYPNTHTQEFSLMGSMLDQTVYLGIILIFTSYYAWKLLTSGRLNPSPKSIFFGGSSIIIVIGIVISGFLLVTVEKPAILPFETGFQTAVQEIALDNGRVIQGFLFGSGFGTYATDFSRWKPISFNQNQNLWSLIFFRSSSFVLDLVATTGILGLSAFLLLLFKALKEIRKNIQNHMAFSLLAIFAVTILLPISFVNQTLIFIILALFAAIQGLKKENNKFFDVEIQIVALKKGLISVDSPHTASNQRNLILPFLLAAVIFAIAGLLGYYGSKYVISDVNFQQSIVAASQNNGLLTYQKQSEAIKIFPYRDGFYRVFSQTNLSLANSLASSQKEGAPANPQLQQQVITLIQQSINSAQTATTLSPQTYLNWQNLSSIYRSLIGFGQNAENFAVLTAQRSTILDPNNPTQYINLGGIYYQLQQWENAQSQFQYAINLKADYPNAYYNLGHVLEQKKDLENALLSYQKVLTLVGKSNDKRSIDQINKEIADIQARIEAKTKEAGAQGISENKNQALNISTPPAKLPRQNPQVKIPPPSIASESSR